MYKLHLIKKYLLKRRIAWVSLLAVMLCTAMVLVVISVMGGWLRMFKASFRGISGDVIVESSFSGFPYYQEMIDRIEKLPEVSGAVVSIESAGLINVGGVRDIVQIAGINIKDMGKIGDFPETLYTQYEQRKKELTAQANAPGVSDEQRKKLLDEAEHPQPSFGLRKDVDYAALSRRWKRSGIIVSDAVLGLHRDKPVPPYRYEEPVTLTVMPIRPHESISAQNAVAIPFWIVDTSHPRIYQMDYNKVYVPFEVLQQNLEMNATETDPARASTIAIKAKLDADLFKLRQEVDDIVTDVKSKHEDAYEYPTLVLTWQQAQGKFIDAVEHEVVLTTFLFGLISVVAVFLIFCIFYMIVVEKTKDIGIIKSVGATGWGVAQIFLGYGLAIGIIGAGSGLLLAYLIVHNINWLHAELTRVMGVPIWDPETYQFQNIPNTMEWHTVGWVVLVAVLSALLGALVPALRAAGMNPVEALRFE